MPRTIIQVRNDTASNFTAADPVLRAGEAGFATDTNTLKIGDGSTAWSSLSSIGGGSAPHAFDGAIALVFEEGSNLSTGTNSGFQFSMGNGDVGDFGAPIPYDFEIIGLSIGCNTTASGRTATIEVYKGTGGASSTATGITATLASNASTGYADATSSPVNGNAGDWIAPKTIAASGGTINAGRVIVWIRPR